MRIGPEPPDLETRSGAEKPPKGSSLTSQIDCSSDKGSRGCGSASFQQAIEFRRTQLETPAACASQRAVDSLRTGWTAPATGYVQRVGHI